MSRALKNSLKSIDFAQLDKMTDTLSDNQIAKLLGDCSKNNVGNYRRKLGVKSHGEKHGIKVGIKGESNTTNRKYFFDEQFFQQIDSEIKAYTLGLLFTDGHIDSSLNRARIALTESDSVVLEQIASAAKLESNLLITKPREGNYQVNNMATLNFNSSNLVKDLTALGLTPSKPNNTTLPILSPELDCHLLRGIFDGDGYIVSTETFEKSYFVGDLSGHYAFLESVNKLLARHQLIGLRIDKMKSINRFRLGRWDLPILDFCYGCNPSIALPRKLERYLALKSVT